MFKSISSNCGVCFALDASSKHKIFVQITCMLLHDMCDLTSVHVVIISLLSNDGIVALAYIPIDNNRYARRHSPVGNTMKQSSLIQVQPFSLLLSVLQNVKEENC